MGRIVNWFSNNKYQVDSTEAQNHVREKYPLLLHKDETIELAFHASADHRDKSYFTSHRILIQDGKGVGSKRKAYLSIPYWCIEAFIIQTAGLVDSDAELKIYKLGDGFHQINFSTKFADIFSVTQFLNCKINWVGPIGAQDYVEGTPPAAATGYQNPVSSMIDWIGDNATQQQPADVEKKFKTDYPVLMEGETVGLAFKSGRDYCVFTDKRCMFIDVKGIGKRVEFSSFPWRTFSAFAVETAGVMDRDTEMYLYTRLVDPREHSMDFQASKVDLMAVQKFLANKILGVDTAPDATVDLRAGAPDDKTSWFFRDNQRPMDAVEMNNHYHKESPILQGSEQVEFAFKGRRDVTLFTTKRVVIIDPKGLTGKRIKYTSIPYKSIVTFAVQTAGAVVDQDAEVQLWTDMMWKTIKKDGADAEDRDPALSFVELDFDKRRVDVISLKRYLSARLLGRTPDIPIKPETYMISTGENPVGKLISWIGDDQHAIDPAELNMQLHNSVPMLLPEEHIVMAFRAGRDVTIFTDRRVLSIDPQGLLGKKISYLSIPFTSIRCFAAKSAGALDRDAEIFLYTANRWSGSKFAFDFRKGKANTIAIQKYLAAVVLDDREEASKYFSTSSSAVEKLHPNVSVNNLFAWALDNSYEVDAAKANDELHKESPILLTNERVVRAYKQGRDMFVYTTHRFIIIDVEGILGKKVEYKSLPFKYGAGFEVETAGHLDRDAEAYLFFDIPDQLKMKQSILVKSGDIMELQQFLLNQYLVHHIPDITRLSI